MGLKIVDICDWVESVVEFFGFGDVINMLIGMYLIGMLLCFVFLVLIMIELDIFLLDEWIGFGDVSFW